MKAIFTVNEYILTVDNNKDDLEIYKKEYMFNNKVRHIGMMKRSNFNKLSNVKMVRNVHGKVIDQKTFDSIVKNNPHMFNNKCPHCGCLKETLWK